MDVMTILGSPRKNGNTAKVLGLFEELIAEGNQVDRLNIADCRIRGCLGCNGCQEAADDPGCVQEDDAVAALVRMIAADVVVYASPLYAWSFSSQLKALIDRHYCLVKFDDPSGPRSLLAGKRAALLVTCAGPVEDNADLIQKIFDRLMEYCQCQVVGKYVVPHCTTPDRIGDIAAETAREMVRDIAGVRMTP